MDKEMEEDQLALEAGPPKRYYRRIMLDYGYLKKLLNLPEGYQISHMVQSEEYSGYIVFVECPKEDRFSIKPGEQVDITMSMLTTFPNGRVVMWHPEFGMEYPIEEELDRDTVQEGPNG